MSWFLKLVGSRAAVKAKIQADQCLSPALKAALSEICDEPPYSGDSKVGISIEGSGHCGNGSYINALKIERVEIQSDPAPAGTDLPPAASTELRGGPVFADGNPLAPTPPVDNAHVAEGCEKFVGGPGTDPSAPQNRVD